MTPHTSRFATASLWLFVVAAVSLPLMANSPANAETSDQTSTEATDQNGTSSGSTADVPQKITYRGRLQDRDGGPISGIFHLEFNLYSTQNAAEASWSTKHFVAVTDGAYQVPLGATRDLPKKLLDRSSFIGVSLVGGGEIMRGRLRMRSPNLNPSPDTAKAGVSQETKKLLQEAKQSNDTVFANLAENALQADRAKVADRVGDLTPKKIRELAKSDERAMKELGEHISDPKAHKNQIGGGIGDARRVMRSVGGSGGNEYTVNCPDGYVVTGIQGGAGRMVDRLAIVCSPLK